MIFIRNLAVGLLVPAFVGYSWLAAMRPDGYQAAAYAVWLGFFVLVGLSVLTLLYLIYTEVRELWKCIDKLVDATDDKITFLIKSTSEHKSHITKAIDWIGQIALAYLLIVGFLVGIDHLSHAMNPEFYEAINQELPETPSVSD